MFGEDELTRFILLNALGIAGICVWHFQGRDRPTGRLIVQFVFFASMNLVMIRPETAPYLSIGVEL